MSKQFMKVESFRRKVELKKIHDYTALYYEELKAYYNQVKAYMGYREITWEQFRELYGPNLVINYRKHVVTKFWAKKVEVNA